MSQACAVIKCNRAQRGLCDCCKQNLCLLHLSEHNTALVSELNPLADEINALGDRLKTFDIQKTIGSSREKLEQWRVECHQKIDQIFERKCRELYEFMDGKVRKQKEEVNQIQSKVAEFIREQETTQQDLSLLTSTVRQLEEQMNNIDKTCFHINIRPLVINESSISINERVEHDIDLSTLSPAYETITYPSGSRLILACNDQYLLIHQNPNLCLIDRNRNTVKQTVWPHGQIYQLCWSSTLDKFIAIDEHNVFLVDKNTLLTETVRTIEVHKWFSCTCSDTALFLSTKTRASSIMQYSLLPSVELIKEWKFPHNCGWDEVITNIVCKNETLALIIKNKPDQSVRMELRSVDTLDRIWVRLLDVTYSVNIVFRFCSLTCNEWLIADYENGRLLHITENGEIKKTMEYNSKPYRVALFEPDILVVLTKKGVNFHKL